MTTGQPIKVPSDRNKYDNEFMESLQLQIDLNQRNLEANRLYKETGQLPASTQMKDTRSNEEKLADVEYLKQQIISDLKPIAEPMFASAVIQGVISSPLNIDNSLFRYLAQNALTFAQTLSKKYKFGIAGDANDVAIMVQFLEDAYVKTKNTFQSIKGYINSNTNEGNKSRSNILSANDTDNIILELKDVIKRLASLPYPLRAVGNIGQQITLTLNLLREIIEFLPSSNQMTQIINRLAVNENLRGNNPEDVRVAVVLKLLQDGLPKLSSIQTIVDRLYRALDDRDGRTISICLNNIMELFGKFISNESRGMMRQFRNDFINQAQMEINRTQELNQIQQTSIIKQEQENERNERNAQRVYVVNPADDAVYVRGGVEGGNGGGEEGEGELGHQGYAQSNASEQSFLDPFARSESAQSVNQDPFLGRYGVGRIPSDSGSYHSPFNQSVSSYQEEEYFPLDYGISDLDYGRYPRSGDVLSIASGNSYASLPSMSEMYQGGKQPNPSSSRYAYLEEEPLVASGENPLHRKPPVRPPQPRKWDVYNLQKAGYSNNGRKVITDSQWLNLQSTYPEEYAYDNDVAKHIFEQNIRSAGTGLKAKRVKKGRGLYSPFGDSEINHKNLENNILTIRRKTKSNYMDLPSKHISKHMKNIIHNIVGGKIANFEDIHNLNDEERNYLNKVISKSNLQDRLSVPAPSKDQADKDNHQWEVMRGEIMAGNDSHELVKKFKILTMKLTRQGLLPKNEVMELFEDLVNLGY
jgi:hypothetical protein